jgi:Zn-dependent membrane protease YugP
MLIYLIFVVAIPMAFGLWAQMRVSRAFSHWKKVAAGSGLTGAEAARHILQAAKIDDVDVVEIQDMLGDHYDPSKKRLCLSPEVYRTPSVAALGIAAHEAGHAIQHAKKYAPLQLRMVAVPATMFVSQALPFIFIGSLFFQAFAAHLITLAIVCFAVIAFFNLVTLPVEFDASKRAKVILRHMNIIRTDSEAQGVNQVLNAAALTYVAAFVAAMANLIYFLLLRRN